MMTWFASLSSYFSMPCKLVQTSPSTASSMATVEVRDRDQLKSDNQDWVCERVWGDRVFFYAQKNIFLHS